MSDNIPLAIVVIESVITTAISAFTAYKALSFRRALVRPVYRDRALWTAVFAIVSIVAIVEYLLYLNGTVTLQLGFIIYPSFLVVFFAIMDSSICTALDQDPFHRNTLQWNIARKILWPFVLAIAILNTVTAYVLGYSLETNGIAYGIVTVIEVYSAVVLVESGIRTPDLLMKKFVLWLGLAAATIAVLGLVAYPIGISNLASNPGGAASFILGPIGSYFILKAAMSLSPTGRLEKSV